MDDETVRGLLPISFCFIRIFPVFIHMFIALAFGDRTINLQSWNKLHDALSECLTFYRQTHADSLQASLRNEMIYEQNTFF